MSHPFRRASIMGTSGATREGQQATKPYGQRSSATVGVSAHRTMRSAHFERHRQAGSGARRAGAGCH
ncbi:MAG: hypothetical protein U1D00_09200, partial [Mycobacterium sp.]|nr:hypothetical protein [Mycobacterium sp.]